MATAIVSDPQSRANLLRELLRLDPALRRAGVHVRLVEGEPDRLLLRLTRGDDELVLERGREWVGLPLDLLKASLIEELLAGGVRGGRRRPVHGAA